MGTKDTAKLNSSERILGISRYWLHSHFYLAARITLSTLKRSYRIISSVVVFMLLFPYKNTVNIWFLSTSKFVCLFVCFPSKLLLKILCDLESKDNCYPWQHLINSSITGRLRVVCNLKWQDFRNHILEFRQIDSI